MRPDAADALLDALCPQGWHEIPRGRDAILPDLQRLDSEIQKLATRLKFQVDTHMLEFAGRCADCLARDS